MPSVTIQGAGSVYPTLTAGTNSSIARQASGVINSAIAGGASVVTTSTGGTAPTPPSPGAALVVNTSNLLNLTYPADYSYVVLGDNPAPVTLSGGGAAGEAIVLGQGIVRVNTGGGSGTVVGGDGDKTINLGATSGYAVYTGGGNDTIDLTASLASGRSTVEAGGTTNAVSANTVMLGAGQTQVRSTGNDSISVGAGSATVQVAGNVQDQVSGGAGALQFINGTAESRVNVSSGGVVSVPSGSATAIGGAGGGSYAGGSSGNNLLVGGLGAVTLRGAGNGDVLIAVGSTGTQLLYAGSGNETLLGSLSSSNNLFVAGSGNDVIVGGSGSDTFVAGAGAATITMGGSPDFLMVNALTAAGAQLTVTDFAPGIDYIQLSNYGGSNSPAALAAGAVNLGSAGSRITFSDGTTITLQGVSTVTAGMFR